MRVSLLVAAFATLCLAPMAGAQDVPFMSVAELKELTADGRVLPGHFLTVAKGTALSNYDVTIRDVSDFAGTQVVIFTTRHFIVAGMSGSPVYARGRDGREKLVGALAYFMSPFAVGEQWGGISPFEQMRREAQESMSAGTHPSQAAMMSYRGRGLMPIALGQQTISDSIIRRAAEHSGLGKLLAESRFTIATKAAGTSSAPVARVLAPGMPIVVDLLEFTDKDGNSTTIAATGTITYVGANGDIYAFGHPFLGARTSRYNFRTCRITGSVYSNYDSFKMAGASSEILGTIEYDGAYGIYGKIGGGDARPVTSFTMDFLRDSKPTNSYRVQVGTSPMTPSIMEMGFALVGEAAHVPFSRQASTASVTATVGLQGHDPVKFSQVFTSMEVPFGPEIVYLSSYEVACGSFLGGVYAPLGSSRFHFTITDARISFDFSDGVTPSLKVASVTFPSKIKFGEDPVLDLLLVSEDNQVTLTRRVVVSMDWKSIEEPTYTEQTKDTEKQAEKVVRGSVLIYTAELFDQFLSPNEKEVETPLYFLNSEDYLTNFRKRLQRNNRMLYARVMVRKRSGTTVSPTAVAAPTPVKTGDGSKGWVLEKKGLTDRKVTVVEEPLVRFWADLPMVPSGYLVGSTQKVLTFEVVK